MLAVSATASWAITFESLHSFPADKSTGQYPHASLTVGPDGSLYGTTSQGGSDDSGTAFKVTLDGTFALLGHFNKADTGKIPDVRLYNAGDGFLYGATIQKIVPGQSYAGAVYKLNPTGGMTVVYDIPGGGLGPKGPVAIASGTPGMLHVLCDITGGILQVPKDGGAVLAPTVFDPSGSQGTHAKSLVRGTDGFLYGTTTGTGYQGAGPVQGSLFRVNSDGSNLTQLHHFSYDTSGSAPAAALAVSPDGVMYGVTYAGGSFGDGVFYRFNPANVTPGVLGSGFTKLKDLDDVPSSTGDLLLASDGKIYGTSQGGGWGFVWRINTDGSGFQRIHSFNGTNGGTPVGGLVQASNGDLYGTTEKGGAAGNGTIFRIDLNLPELPINHPPIASADFAFSTGSFVQVDVLANDFDADGGPETLTIAIDTPPSHGTATVQDGGIRYTPNGGYAGYDEFRYTITDPEGLTSKATVFVSDDPPPAGWQTGAYNGILNLDPTLSGSTLEPRGQLIINMSETGVFTGKLFTNRKVSRIRGVLTENGVAIAVLKLPNRSKAVLFMTPAQGNVMGAYLFGKETWTGTAAPLLTLNPPVTEQYTVRFDPAPGLPEGFGFGVMKVLPNGAAAIVGKLGDGTKLAVGTTRVSVNGDAWIPICTSTLKDGYFSGFFQDTGSANPSMLGQFRWIRPEGKSTLPYPAGFSGSVLGALYPFVPSPRGTIPMSFGGDNTGSAGVYGSQFPTPIAGLITQSGARLIPTDPLKSISINRTTGIFTGKVKKDGVSVSFQGAINQGDNEGFGQYFRNKLTGPVFLSDDF